MKNITLEELNRSIMNSNEIVLCKKKGNEDLWDEVERTMPKGKNYNDYEWAVMPRDYLTNHQVEIAEEVPDGPVSFERNCRRYIGQKEGKAIKIRYPVFNDNDEIAGTNIALMYESEVTNLKALKEVQ